MAAAASSCRRWFRFLSGLTADPAHWLREPEVSRPVRGNPSQGQRLLRQVETALSTGGRAGAGSSPLQCLAGGVGPGRVLQASARHL